MEDFSFTNGHGNGNGINGLPKIHTHVEKHQETVSNGNDTNDDGNGCTPTNAMAAKDVCTDDSVPSVRVSTLQELHSLQRKRSAPSTPKDHSSPLDDLRQRQQLQSIRSVSQFVSLYLGLSAFVCNLKLLAPPSFSCLQFVITIWKMSSDGVYVCV